MINKNSQIEPSQPSDEWLLREAGGNPKLIELIGAREAEIERVINEGLNTVGEQGHLAGLERQIVGEKLAMGLNPGIHPEIDYTVSGEEPNLQISIAQKPSTDK